VLEGLQVGEVLIGCFDEERLIQVLNNLISNAIKYSPRGGEIEIGVRQTPEHPEEVLIWVRDHGIGITAGALSHIFERFYRSDQLGRGIAGLGIGLYLVKEFVTRHGGHVWAESSEGVGSIFYVQLPLSKRHE
jgi:two-component system sensor histidine kinase VicK